MKRCELCNQPFPVKVEVNGKVRNLQRRRYCLACSPFLEHNTRQLEVSEEMRQARAAEVRRRKYRKHQRKTRRQRKRWLVDFFGGSCQICGYCKDCPAAYDFHHRDPALKEFEIGSQGLLRRWDEVLAEVKKCVLLCCRCHVELHSGLHNDWDISDRTGSSAGRAQP